MDPHFHEYLAAIAAMHDVYGDRADDHPTDFHDDHQAVAVEAAVVPAAV